MGGARREKDELAGEGARPCPQALQLCACVHPCLSGERRARKPQTHLSSRPGCTGQAAPIQILAY